MFPRYKNFLTRHVDSDITSRKCDSVIHSRVIVRVGTKNDCRELHTFIQADKRHIKAVCEKGGTPEGNNRFESTNPFPIVKCTLKKGERHPHCEYRGNEFNNRKIVLECDAGWPVHYVEDRVI
uniref:Ribonuclease like 2 n=1 Tax=Cyprinus carpio TaxID=7962 RepID=A0A8C1T3J8_CYPCA